MPEPKSITDRFADWLMGDEKKKTAEDLEKARLEAEEKAKQLKKMVGADPTTLHLNKIDQATKDALEGK